MKCDQTLAFLGKLIKQKKKILIKQKQNSSKPFKPLRPKSWAIASLFYEWQVTLLPKNQKI